MLSVVMVESDDTDQRSIKCFGALDIVVQGGQPRFRTFHLTATGMGGSAALCERLAQISAYRHVILGQPAIHGDFWDWQDLLSTSSLFVSAIRICEHHQPSGLSVLSLPSARMAEISQRMKLGIKRPTTLLDEARLAPERAQLLWLGYVESRTRRRNCDSIFASFQAWSAIERARPLTF